MSTLHFGRYRVETSSEDRILFPAARIRKGELVDYYRRVAEPMLPHLRGRALTLHRFPEGLDGSGFIQQKASDHFPDWLSRVRIERREGGAIDHAVCDKAASLVYLANQNTIELHTWLSREDALESPDQMIFDLDPGAADFEEVRAAARRLRAMLDALGLAPFVKTTGSSGLHVLVPLDRSAGFDAVRDFARDVAELVARREPERFTLEQRKDKRRGRVYLDVLRNAFGQTAVAPYSVRARRNAPVATPLDWKEITDARLRPDRYTMRNLFRRLGRRECPWKGMARHARSLNEPRRRLERLQADAAPEEGP